MFPFNLLTTAFNGKSRCNTFDDTVKNNISYAKHNASEEEIIKACKFATAGEFIQKLPNGYDTMIGKTE